MSKARLELPCREDMILVARMTTSGIAARAELSIDDVEDMKLAADEVFRALLFQNAGYSSVVFGYELSEKQLSFTAEGIGGTKTVGDYRPDMLISVLNELCGGAEADCENGVLKAVTVKSHEER